MRLRIFSGFIFTCLISFSSASEMTEEIDPLLSSPQNYRLLFENAEVRVIRYTLLPGEKDNWHTHPAKLSYVIEGGDLEIHTADGNSFSVKETADTAGWLNSVGRHYAENTGATAVSILLVEVRNAHQGKEDFKKFESD